MRNAFIAVILLALCVQVYAQEDVSYNITSVEAEQLSNAVRVKISADGTIGFVFLKWRDSEYYDWDLCKRQGYRWTEDCLKFSRVIGMHLPHARSKVGNYVPIGKYPVDYVELAPVGESQGPNVTGLDIVVHLYAGARMRYVASDGYYTPGDFGGEGYTDYNAGAYVDNSRHFDVIPESGKSSVNVIVTSDRQPVVSERLAQDEVADENRGLRIIATDGLLDVHARNARLADFARELQIVSGRRIRVEPAVDRVVTAEIPSISFEELIRHLCLCYGLTVAGSPEDDLVVRETLAQSSESYAEQEAQRIPLRWLGAETALGLLPNFLTACMHVDKGNNQLLCSASPEFAEKVRADLAILDRPTKAVIVEASVIEVPSTLDVDTALGLDDANRVLDASLHLPNVEFGVRQSNLSPAEFTANLSALISSGTARSVSTARLSVLSGESGTIEAGVDKYVQVRDPYGERDTVVPVKAGMSLTVKPLVIGSGVQLALTSEVNSISMIDPITKLPVVDTRKVSGTFQVQSGESIVVGGLDQVQLQTTRRRLPVLGQLPIVGGLFCENVKQNLNSRLMLILAPRIMEDNDAVPSK